MKVWSLTILLNYYLLLRIPPPNFSHGHRRKAGRELQTELDTMINGGKMMMKRKISRSRSPGREYTQRLCTCYRFSHSCQLFLVYLRSIFDQIIDQFMNIFIQKCLSNDSVPASGGCVVVRLKDQV